MDDVDDDGDEVSGPWNEDGSTREEYLDTLQMAHDAGNVQVDDGYWLAEEDAINELGAERVAELRAQMAAYLDREWAALAAGQDRPPR